MFPFSDPVKGEYHGEWGATGERELEGRKGRIRRGGEKGWRRIDSASAKTGVRAKQAATKCARSNAATAASFLSALR